ncbi:MAG: molybdopterin-synthase adenylyltransferase MoeB [Gammaproteobacteria bacterium]|nr:MAG: molybdopterin-synthase adenylyltransferase MoeB [Gammaproteobacteria bacterium]
MTEHELPDLDDTQLLRYSRQIMLPEFGFEAQQRLLGSRVLIVGMGGLGSPAALYLAAAGVGRLVLADPDQVELSNLQRQILHGTSDAGRAKVASARDRLTALNPDVRVDLLPCALEGEALQQAVQSADVVLDCSDNFPTRFAVNAACMASATPLVSGAAVRFEGQLAVFDPRLPESPCYRCLYRDEGETPQTCAENGILSPVVGVIGSLQALEAIRLLAGLGTATAGRLLVFDGLHQEFRTLRLPRDPDCPACGHRPAA